MAYEDDELDDLPASQDRDLWKQRNLALHYGSPVLKVGNPVGPSWAQRAFTRHGPDRTLPPNPRPGSKR